MDETEQRFMTLIDAHRNIIYKVCLMFSDILQTIEEALAELKDVE